MMDAKFKKHAILVLLLCFATTGCMAGESVKRAKGAFCGSTRIAVFQVERVKFLGEKLPEGAADRKDRIRQYEVTISVKDSLPEPLEPKQLAIHVEHGYGIEGQRLFLQDWFPLEQGAMFIAHFNDASPNSAIQLGVLAGEGGHPFTEDMKFPAYDFDANRKLIDAGWKDCKRFQKIVAMPEAEIAKALAEALKDETNKPTEVFFKLAIFSLPSQYASEDVVSALAQYLRAEQTPIGLRVKIVEEFLPGTGSDTEGARALGTAVIKVILDAARARQYVGNMVDRFLTSFINKGIRPEIDAKTRAELRKVAEDEKLNYNPQSRNKLSVWVEKN
jgi:hypothetical protein